jgi:serine O-acetyltransferase
LNTEFYNQILARQHKVEAVPSNAVIANWALTLLNLIFPERQPGNKFTELEVQSAFNDLKIELIKILCATKACDCKDNEVIADNFFNELPELYRKLNNDLTTILAGDPAAHSEFEIIRCYPGFFAISMYRIAHQLLVADVPLIPRILTEYAHSVTGIDIHPAAVIGEHLYIDHGTGLVIGETTVIGNYVKLYQGVTLGALSVEKYMANTKRHPTISDNVIIYSGATILGGETIVGENCIIGGNVWLTKSVPANSTVYHQSVMKIAETKNLKHD